MSSRSGSDVLFALAGLFAGAVLVAAIGFGADLFLSEAPIAELIATYGPLVPYL